MNNSILSSIHLPLLDAVALAWFLLSWFGYNVVIDRLMRRPFGLNQHMQAVRADWMRNMVDRDERVIDAILIGHLIHSVAYFASATVLLLAALVGVMAALGQAYGAIMELEFIVKTPKGLFELKLLLLTGVLVYAFFKFTWALRQYNYCCALIGAVPPRTTATDLLDQFGQSAADVLSLAVTSFNCGLRAYYFALAVLSWLVHPWLFMILSTWMVLILLRRQLRSRTFRAIQMRAGKEHG